MFNIQDLMGKERKGIHVFSKRLNVGEIVNIYGEPYVGKTSSAFYILGQNPEIPFLYFATESFDQPYKDALLKRNKKIYFSKLKDLKAILNSIKMMKINVVIDSLNGITYEEDNDKILAEVFETVVNFDLNMIVVSQIKNYNREEWYDSKRILDFFAYKIKVEKKGDYFDLNKECPIAFKEIWNEAKN